MVGRTELTGGPGTAAVTTAVCSDAAVSEPAELLPVTETRSVEPTSSKVTSYVWDAAPGMSTQLAPSASQRFHWYAYEIGGVPAHDPLWAVSVSPS
jgi:hypothetical protein